MIQLFDVKRFINNLRSLCVYTSYVSNQIKLLNFDKAFQLMKILVSLVLNV